MATALNPCDFLSFKPIDLLKDVINKIWYVFYPIPYFFAKIYFLILILYDIFTTVIYFNRYVMDYVIGFNKRKKILLLFNPINFILSAHIIISVMDNSFIMWSLLFFYVFIIFCFRDTIHRNIIENYINEDFTNLEKYNRRRYIYFMFINYSITTKIFKNL